MLVFFLTLLLIAPAVAARLFTRARWKTIGIAFAVWYGGLVLMGLLSGNPGEGLGWAAILAMFLTTFMVPVIVFVMHSSGLAEKRPRRVVQSARFDRGLRPRPNAEI